MTYTETYILRAVQTKTIQFSQSISESDGHDFIQSQSRYMSDPALSDIDFKNKMAWVWTTLKNLIDQFSLEILFLENGN